MFLRLLCWIVYHMYLRDVNETHAWCLDLENGEIKCAACIGANVHHDPHGLKDRDCELL